MKRWLGSIPLRYGTYSLILWVLVLIPYMYVGFIWDYPEVPTTVNYPVVVPFISIEGALWANMVYLLWEKNPDVREVGFLTWFGSFLFVLIRYIDLDWSDGIILSSVLVGFPLIALCFMKRKRSMMRMAAALSWVIFFFFALYTHLGLIFKMADEVGLQRTWSITAALESPNPMTQSICRHEHVDCYIFDPNIDKETMNLPRGAWEAMASIYENAPLYEVQTLKITEYSALNNRADYSLIGMMTHGDTTYVAISRVPHMLEWRILGNRYMLTSISIAYLAWGGLLFTVALTHTWMFSKRRSSRSGSP